MPSFKTETEFSGAITTTLQAQTLPADVITAIAAGIAQGEADNRDDAPSADGALNLRLGGWVLRPQDVPMTELIAIVGAAVAAVLAPGAVAATAVVTALSGFASLTWKAWRKGAKLSKPETAVLGFLGVQGPMSLDDLKTKAPAALAGVTAEDVERAVASLQDVALRDGDIVELIRKDATGLWRARPI